MRNLLILLLIYCFSFNVQAETLDFKNNGYLLVGAGMADWNLEDNSTDVARVLGITPSSDDESAPALKVGLGIELNPMSPSVIFALETYFQYLGKGKMKFINGGTYATSGEIDAYLYHLDLVGKVPLDQIYEDLSFLARVGYARSQASVDVTFGGTTTDGYSNSNEVTYGAGFEIKNFRLEYQQLNDMSSDPRIYTLGYVFRFNGIKE